MSEDEPTEAEIERQAEAQQTMVTKISGDIAELLQNHAAREAPPGEASDDQIDEFLIAVQIALGQHLIATVICYHNEGICVACASHEALDEVLRSYGAEIIAMTTGPLTSVH